MPHWKRRLIDQDFTCRRSFDRQSSEWLSLLREMTCDWHWRREKPTGASQELKVLCLIPSLQACFCYCPFIWPRHQPACACPWGHSTTASATGGATWWDNRRKSAKCSSQQSSVCNFFVFFSISEFCNNWCKHAAIIDYDDNANRTQNCIAYILPVQIPVHLIGTFIDLQEKLATYIDLIYWQVITNTVWIIIQHHVFPLV